MPISIPTGSLVFSRNGQAPLTFVTQEGEIIDSPDLPPTIPAGTTGSNRAGLFQFSTGELVAMSFTSASAGSSIRGNVNQLYDSNLDPSASLSLADFNLGLSTNYVDRIYSARFYHVLYTIVGGILVGRTGTTSRREVVEYNLLLQRQRSWFIPDHGYDFINAGEGGVLAAETEIQTFAVSPDGSNIYYYDFGDGPNTGAQTFPTSLGIFSHDTGSDTSSLFYTLGTTDVSTGDAFVMGPSSLMTLPDGSLIFGCAKGLHGPNTGFTGTIYHISSNGGTLLITTIGGWVPQRITPGLTDDSFWVQSRAISSNASVTLSSIRIQEIRVGDGAVLNQFDRTDTDESFWATAFCVVNKLIPVIPPGPPPSGRIPEIPCTPASIVTSPSRNAGCNQGGVGWTPLYTGSSGYTVIGSNPLDGMFLTGERIVRVWAEVNHDDGF